MNTVESNKVFPFVAWGLFIGLSLLTLYLAMELQATAAYLEEKTQESVTALNNA